MPIQADYTIIANTIKDRPELSYKQLGETLNISIGIVCKAAKLAGITRKRGRKVLVNPVVITPSQTQETA